MKEKSGRKPVLEKIMKMSILNHKLYHRKEERLVIMTKEKNLC